jgi:transcriptional regulator with PAS, ATPase and Fis domain
VNCAALTESLLESELFGHEKGAFTGAIARRKGKFESADGGTLFLDEVGDVSPKLQLELLRVLEERTFHRVGGNESISVDVRIVAATNRDLKKAVADGRFREDLFYRLNVIPITIPPLRERREDIPLLVERFVEGFAVEQKKQLDGVSHEAMAALLAHDWPGNVRELRNVLERGAVVATGPLVQVDDLGLAGPAVPDGAVATSPGTLEDMERRHIGEVLLAAQGNVTHAARTLGIDRVTLYKKIRKYGLKRTEDEEAAPALVDGGSAVENRNSR